MNILMIHPHDIFSPSEPWTVRIRQLAREMVAGGHEAKIAYFPLTAVSPRPRSFEGIPCYAFSRKVGGVFWSTVRQMFPLAAWADVIHVQKCFYHAALPALILAYTQGKPLHYDWDDWEIKIFHDACRQPRYIGFVLAILERWLPVLCDTVSVSSRRLRRECRCYGVAPQRIFDAPVGADLRRFHPAIKGTRIRERYHITTPLVLYMGQLHSGQYAELFVTAARLILNETRDITFMVVGGGHRLPQLKEQASELELADDMIFTDAIAHHEVPQYLAAADIAVACFEDNDITRCKSPLKIAEYMASGKAIVASSVGEVMRMLGGAAILVPPGEAQPLAAGILRLLRDEPLRKRFQQHARQRAEKIYNWRSTAATLLRAYAGGRGDAEE